MGYSTNHLYGTVKQEMVIALGGGDLERGVASRRASNDGALCAVVERSWSPVISGMLRPWREGWLVLMTAVRPAPVWHVDSGELGGQIWMDHRGLRAAMKVHRFRQVLGQSRQNNPPAAGRVGVAMLLAGGEGR